MSQKSLVPLNANVGCLSNVRWLGGSPCSGKSSVAEILAARYGVQVYHVDDVVSRHMQRLSPEDRPVTSKWLRTPWNELWMQAADVLLIEAIAAYTEQFSLVVEDLCALVAGTDTALAPIILAEGTTLLPDLVLPLLSDRSYAFWMVPSEAFQREMYPKRGDWVGHVLDTCDDPDGAMRNWMNRDVAFARWVQRQAADLNLACAVVDGGTPVHQYAAALAGRFNF